MSDACHDEEPVISRADFSQDDDLGVLHITCIDGYLPVPAGIVARYRPWSCYSECLLGGMFTGDTMSMPHEHDLDLPVIGYIGEGAYEAVVLRPDGGCSTIREARPSDHRFEVGMFATATVTSVVPCGSPIPCDTDWGPARIVAFAYYSDGTTAPYVDTPRSPLPRLLAEGEWEVVT